MLPNFIIIGAAKSGTTSLFYQLKNHPDIFMPHRKELDFFVDHQKVGNWDKGQEYYEQLFAGWQGEKAVGEASPRYTKSPILKGVPERMARIIPQVKLIYILRNPIDQIWSYYNHTIYHTKKQMSFESMLKKNSILMASANYPHQLKNYLSFFPKDQILLLLFEDYILDSQKTVGKICRFLDIDDQIESYTDRIHNRTKVRKSPRWPALMPYLSKYSSEEKLSWLNFLLMKRLGQKSMKKETRIMLLEKFKDQRLELASLTDLDLSKWKQK